jgi:hypothetical protein
MPVGTVHAVVPTAVKVADVNVGTELFIKLIGNVNIM